MSKFWILGGNVWSGDAGDYVSANNPTYLQWLENPRNVATVFAGTEAELGAVLARDLLRPSTAPSAAAVLDGYKDAHAGQVVATVIFKILFRQENDIREIKRTLGILGSPENVTPAQARAYVKTVM